MDGLFFTSGCVATKAELEQAEKLGITMFRNGAMASREDFLEKASRVAGAVPVGYASMPGCQIVGIEEEEPTEENTRPNPPAKAGKGK